MKTPFAALVVASFSLTTASFAATHDGGSADQLVAVAKPSTRRVDAALAEVITERWLKLSTPGFRFVPTACADAACAKKEGAAGILLKSSISRLGQRYFVTQALVDVQTGEVERTVEREVGADEEALAKAMTDATASLLRFDAPTVEAAPVKPNLSPAAAPQVKVEKTVRVENQNKKRALYACAGGAMVAVGGFLFAAGSEPDSLTAGVGGLAMVGGVSAFVIGGAAYVLLPEHQTKTVLVPSVSKDGAAVSLSGRF